MPRKLLPGLDDALLVSGAAVSAGGIGLSVAAVAGWQLGLGAAAVVLGVLALAAGVMVAKGGA